MQIKLGNLKNAETALGKLSQAQLPMKVSFALAKMIRAVSGDLQDFEGKRIVLVKKYGDATEQGTMQVKQENIEVFLKEMQELSDIIVEVDITPIKLSLLSAIEFSAAELTALEDFLEDDISGSENVVSEIIEPK